MIFKNLFKKKRVEVPKMDLSKYRLKLTIKAICMYEKLTGKSFYELGIEDMIPFMYCVLKSNNDLDLKLSTFYVMIEDERILRWIMKKADDMFEVLEQYVKEKNGEKEERGEEERGMTITDIANTLIIDYGLSAEWVMSELELWQIEDLYKIAEEKIKNKYSEERLWTYLTVLPHVDGKKLSSPDKLLPFPWEADEKKKKQEEELTMQTQAVLGLGKKNVLGEEVKKDG